MDWGRRWEDLGRALALLSAPVPADSSSFVLQYEEDELSCEMLALATTRPVADSPSEAG